MTRKDATCKKCNQSLKGHLDKKICPSEHGHIETHEGTYTCSNKSCEKTFTTLHNAHKHSISISCKYFKGVGQQVPCPNSCGKVFTGAGANGNALTHSKTTMCEKHPDRINNPNYRTTISHVITNNTKRCNNCKLMLHIDQFAKKENSKNDSKLDYVCYKCRSCLAMRQGVINRAKKEGNSFEGLTIEYIKSLITKYCPVFCVELQYGGAEQCDNSATIDAIVHEKGHIKGNLKIISKKANTIKNNSTLEEMGLLLNAIKNWKAPIGEINRPNKIKSAKTTKEQTNKVCSLCREEKQLDLFHKSNSATLIGVSNKCIRCSALSSMIKNAKIRCKQTERLIEINDYYLHTLTKELVYCPVLGIELLYGGTGSIKDNSASIDRFDTTKGYIKGNVWIISHKANRMKSNATLDEIEKVYEYMKLELPQ
jgi:hypothetical protein